MPSNSDSLIVFLTLSLLLVPFLVVPMVMAVRGRRDDERNRTKAAAPSQEPSGGAIEPGDA